MIAGKNECNAILCAYIENKSDMTYSMLQISYPDSSVEKCSIGKINAVCNCIANSVTLFWMYTNLEGPSSCTWMPSLSRAGATSTADTVLAVALFEIRPYLAFANFVACYGLGLQRINTSLLWASPVSGTSTNQHLAVSVAVATYLIFSSPF